MHKPISDNPPPYSEVINTPTTVGGISPPVHQSYPSAPPNPYQPSGYPFAPAGGATVPPVQQPGFVPSYGTIGSNNISVPTEIIVIGGCPSCRIGFLEDYFSCLGLFCAIFFFPLGILCCLALKTKRCTNCGAEF